MKTKNRYSPGGRERAVRLEDVEFTALKWVAGSITCHRTPCFGGFFEFWAMSVPDYDTLQAFFTRFVTHSCAPGFALIMGAGMVFFAKSRREAGWTEAKIIRHYWIRAAVLVAIMLTLENLVWSLAYPSQADNPAITLEFGVLFSLAGAMALGSLLLRAPAKALAALGVVLAVITQWLVNVHLGFPEPMESVSLPAMFSFIPSGLKTENLRVFVLYPVLPWFVFALFGMVLARRSCPRGCFRLASPFGRLREHPSR